ncbi:MAG: hypothetical protein AMDU2_EPLC00008G0004 [Thermoplasmatales archaeon E-plasma]|nr:MAG: hypothetical protein AMDU2_EPLC00008G0004 [Thermoplasmatales archaeon E-plasma]
MATKTPMRKAGHGKISVFAVGVGFVIFVFLYAFVLIGIDLIFSIVVIALTFTILEVKNGKDDVQEENLFCIIGEAKEEDKANAQGKLWRENQRFRTYVRKVNIVDYIQNKRNTNIALIGGAGSGKTTLTYYIIQQFTERLLIIIQYKNTDRYTELGYPSLKIAEAIPNVFADIKTFIEVFLVAFHIAEGKTGIQAGAIPSLVEDIAKKSKNWKEFKSNISDRINDEKDGNMKASLQAILNNINSVYSEKMIDYPIPEEAVLDFEGLTETQFIFYGEYLLREIFSDMLRKKRLNSMFFIDECSLFLKTKDGMRKDTIIPQISRLIRSTGAMLLATQELDDLGDVVQGNTATIFSSKQLGERSLNRIKAINLLMHWIITRLYAHEFVDIATDNLDDIYIYILKNPRPQFYPVKEMSITANRSVREEEDKEEIVYNPTNILPVLDMAKNIQDIAKSLSITKEKDDIANVKLKIKGILKKMVVNQEVVAERTDNVKFHNEKAYVVEEVVYCRKGSYPSDFHSYLVSACAEILKQKGISYEVKPDGVSSADIETKKSVYEIETGFKNSIDDIDSRIKRYLKEGKTTIIIVPNDFIKPKYEVKYPQIKVLTLVDLWGEMQEEEI